MIFNDTITLYKKTDEGWDRKVIYGVQWSDQYEKENSSGKISIARYSIITFPAGTYETLNLNPANEEDGIFYGEIAETPTDVRGYRLSDLMEKYPRSGRIKTVNDNSNRNLLKNIKVVIG